MCCQRRETATAPAAARRQQRCLCLCLCLWLSAFALPFACDAARLFAVFALFALLPDRPAAAAAGCQAANRANTTQARTLPAAFRSSESLASALAVSAGRRLCERLWLQRFPSERPLFRCASPSVGQSEFDSNKLPGPLAATNGKLAVRDGQNF